MAPRQWCVFQRQAPLYSGSQQVLNTMSEGFLPPVKVYITNNTATTLTEFYCVTVEMSRLTVKMI